MSPIELLRAQTTARPTLQRLGRLCLDDPDPKFLADLLMFLGTREAAANLNDWAEESVHAAGLERLSLEIWANAALQDALNPLRTARRVEDRYSPTERKSQFPAALAAARRSLDPQPVAEWIQRLRLYLLLRQLDALEIGVLRDKHSYDVANLVREVVQMRDHPWLRWIQPLIGSARSMADFEAETVIRARQARRAAVEKSTSSDPSALGAVKSAKAAVRFYDALLAIMEYRPWRPMYTEASLERLDLASYWLVKDAGGVASVLEQWSDELSPALLQLGDPDSGGLTFVRQLTSQHVSQKTKERLGTKVRLEHLVETLFLPHEWHALTGDEEAAVESRILALLQASQFQDRLGATCALIGRLAGRSMHDVAAIPLCDDTQHAWYLDAENGALLRRAPRFNRRWRAEGAPAAAHDWIRPLLGWWTIRLSDAAGDTLRQAVAIARQAGTLGAIWGSLGGGSSLEHWFETHFIDSPELQRLTSPHVGTSMGLVAFRRSGDVAFARLVSSDHRTALPATCAYSAYTGREVYAALSQHICTLGAALTEPTHATDLNVAGSELDLIIDHVARAFGGLIDRIDACAQSDDWVRHHNLLTALVTLSLLASTGARPVNSPFENLSWFDLKRGILFVEDKVSGPTRGSRLCVLSDFARGLLEDHYLPHLRRLAGKLQSHAPSFAREIERLISGDAEAQLPLLFILRGQPQLDWIEVSEAQLELTCEFGWPLPWNLLRHWMATELRRGGLHPDIRAALLAHADRNAEPHGDFSPRVPADDLEAARPVVNRMQLQLRWRLPAKGDGPAIGDLIGTPSEPAAGAARAFGRRARGDRRRQAHDAARTLAVSEIQAYLMGRTVDQLSSEQLDELARRMLFRGSGSMPHVLASLRYEVFEGFIQEQWRQQGKQAILRRRYVLAPEAEARFTDYALQSHDALADAATAFGALIQSRPDRDEGPIVAAALAALDMVFTSRLAYFAPLAAVVTNSKKQYRLVRHQARYWFEWAFGAEWIDGKPVFRVEISLRAAQWLSRACRSDRQLTSTPELPQSLFAFADRVARGARNVGTLLRPLVEVRDQVNVFELPGYQAAFLSGRRSSAALPHLDWIRLVSGQGAVKPASSNSNVKPELLDDVDAQEALTYFRTHRRPSSVSAEDSLVRCKALMTAITRVLGDRTVSQGAVGPDSIDESRDLQPAGIEYRASTVIADDQANQSAQFVDTKLLTNGQKAGRIKRLVDSSGFGLGAAPFLLAHYIVHILTRRPKHGKRDRLRGSTAYRYWMSLAGPFCDAVADKTFVGADEEDLTEWYAGIIHASDSASQPQEIDEPPIDGRSDAPLRTMRQLLDFHRFLQDTYGTVDPDWAEVAPDLVAPVGRPGIVLAREYEALLHRVVGDYAVDDLSGPRLQQAFTLSVCYRFGLRISEAIGLSREDWVDAGSTVLVAVRSNRVRPLKTPASRRMVPQIEPWSDLEIAVTARVIGDWQRRDGLDASSPLLVGVRKDTLAAVKASVGTALLGKLKDVTRNAKTTVHTLRHTFAMRTTARLLNLPLEPGDPPDLQRSVELRELLLGTVHLDRRALWAVARLLGHAAPACTLLSYVNCMHLWLLAPACLKQASSEEAYGTELRCIDIDQYLKVPNYLAKVTTLSPSVTEELTQGDRFLRGLQFLKLMAVDQPEERAESTARLPKGFGKVVGRAFARAGEKLEQKPARYLGYTLLGSTRPTRLQTLIDRAAAVEPGTRANGRRIKDWFDTIGAGRQVLAFADEHFTAISSFLEAMNFGPQDIALVHEGDAHRDLFVFASRAALAPYLTLKHQVPIGNGKFAKAFQLDTVQIEKGRILVKERMAMIPRFGGAISNTHELATLWLMWNLSALHESRESRTRAAP